MSHDFGNYVQEILDAAPVLSDEKREAITALFQPAGDHR